MPGSRRAVDRPIRSDQLHGHSGDSSSIRAISTRSIASSRHARHTARRPAIARHRRSLGARLCREGLSPDGLRHRSTAAAGSACVAASTSCAMHSLTRRIASMSRKIPRRLHARHSRQPRRACLRRAPRWRFSTRRPDIDWEYLPVVVPAKSMPTTRRDYDAIYVNMARVPATAVARADCRLRVSLGMASATTPSTFRR